MNCPHCKTKELLPARLNSEDRKGSGLKCPECLRTYILDETNHLRLIVKPAPTEPVDVTGGSDTGDKEEKSEQAERRLNDHDKCVIFQRLVAGDKPMEIAEDLECNPQAVRNYSFNHKAQIEEAKRFERKKPKESGIEKKDNYDYNERLTIVEESRSGAVAFGTILEKYGISKAQLRGWIAREDYYREVLKEGAAGVKSARQKRHNILKQIKVIDTLPLNKALIILNAYIALLDDDLKQLKVQEKGVREKRATADRARTEIMIQVDNCQSAVAGILREAL